MLFCSFFLLFCMNALKGIGKYQSEDLLTVSSSCLVDINSHGSVGVVSGHVEGVLRYISIPQNSGSMEMEGADENAPFSLDIYRGNYPIVDVSSLASDKGYVLIASAFMDSKVKFFLRSKRSDPLFHEIATLNTKSTPTCICLKETSFVRRNNTDTWNLSIYYGSQDKNVHLVSVSLTIDANVLTQSSMKEINTVKFSGHSDHVRDICLLNDHMASCSDDGTIRVWESSSFVSDTVKSTRDYSIHAHNILCIALTNQFVITGGKDRKIVLLDLTHGKKSKGPLRREIMTPSVVCSLVVHGNRIYSAGSDGYLRIYDLGTTFGIIEEIKIDDCKIVSVALCKNMLTATTASGCVELFSIN